jgi:hypothetical protein
VSQTTLQVSDSVRTPALPTCNLRQWSVCTAMAIGNYMMISHIICFAQETISEIANVTSYHLASQQLDKLGTKRAPTTDIAVCGLPSCSSINSNGLGHLNYRNNHKPASPQSTNHTRYARILSRPVGIEHFTEGIFFLHPSFHHVT